MIPPQYGTVAFSINLTGTFVNMEFSTINFIIIQINLGFTLIRREKIRQVMLTFVPLLGIQSRLAALFQK